MKEIVFNNGQLDPVQFPVDYANEISLMAEMFDCFGMLRGWRTRWDKRDLVDFIFDHAIVSFSANWTRCCQQHIYTFAKDYYAASQPPDRP